MSSELCPYLLVQGHAEVSCSWCKRRLLRKWDGYERTSKRGVPHLVLRGLPGGASVCWFSRTKVWRVFTPYPCAESQVRHDCATLMDVEAYLESRVHVG